jgi:hypothetical protein
LVYRIVLFSNSYIIPFGEFCFFPFCVHAQTNINLFNPRPPIYICRTALLTSRCCFLNIYSTNILTEYFKHAA